MTVVPDIFNQEGIQLPILILGWGALAVLLIGVAICVFAFKTDGDFSVASGPVVAILGVALGIIWLLMLLPFDEKYWHYYEVQGEVTSVSNVLTEASGALTRQPVVTIEGLDRPVVVDDPRAVDLEGEVVTLRCTIEWHYDATDTYECRIRDY